MSHVLVVEQDEPLVRLMRWFLAEAGFEAAVVNRVDDVRLRFATAAPALVILNTGLPVAEKRALFAAWKRDCPGIAILDVSMTFLRPGDGEDLAADARLGFPFHADTLIETVRDLLAARDA